MEAFFGLVMLLGLMIIAYPFIPLLSFQLAPPKQAVYPYPSRLLELPIQGSPEQLPEPGDKPTVTPQPRSLEKPKDRRLVIPTIGVDIPITEGDAKALLKGAWRIPETSNDPAKSNMVLSAHRFRYRPPSSRTFYLLDKVGVGDRFIVYWDGEEYDYEIREVKIVLPNAVEILRPTEKPTVTLFTCAPLFSTAKRLVVVGTQL